MKWFVSFVFILFLNLIAVAQVCEGDIYLSSQEEVDLFDNCNIIEGDLSINSSNITDLSPLLSIQEIRGNLSIRNLNNSLTLSGLQNLVEITGYFLLRNTSLENLQGLSSLEHIGGDFAILENQILTSLEGLSSNINRIEGDLNIRSNPNLENLEGLNNIEYISEDLLIKTNSTLSNINGLNNLLSVENKIEVSGNNVLQNIEGLSNLRRVESDFKILNNNSLVSLEGLQNLSFVGGNFSIQDNQSLSDCCGINPIFCGLNFGALLINDNNSNCYNVPAFISYCEDQNQLSIDSVSPHIAVLNESVVFTVYGENLPPNLNLFIEDCTNIEELILESNINERKFTCTPTGSIGDKDGYIKKNQDTDTLFFFAVNILDESDCIDTYSTIEVSICEGTNFEFGNNTYYSSGIYVDTLQNISGCDSIVTLNLRVSMSCLPSLFLSQSILDETTPIVINGSNFSSGDSISLLIQNGSYLYSKRVAKNTVGAFDYQLNYQADMPPGIYSITVYDENLLNGSVSEQFIILEQLPDDSSYQIEIISQLNNIVATELFSLTWSDFTFSDDLHPTQVNRAVRVNTYNIYYRTDASDWVLMDTYTQHDILNEIVFFSWEFTIPNAGTYYLKIEDFFDHSRFVESEPFEVTAFKDASITNLWDNSYPELPDMVAPRGVAADSISRIIIHIKDNSPDVDIESVSVVLLDPQNEETSASYLGKIMPLSDVAFVHAYSDEANNANSTNVSIETSEQNYYFWYVSPDHFDDNTLANLSRQVNVQFTINYTDGETEVKNHLVEIVRPPLMLVHGLASDPSTWDAIRRQYGFYLTELHGGGGKYIVVEVPQMGSDKHFADNAYRLLDYPNQNLQQGSFAYTINKMRMRGYATNQVDYIGHSMGGNMLRAAVELNNRYKAVSSTYDKYKNYGYGYVNKAITINTPHSGSPWADLIEDLTISINDSEESTNGFLKVLLANWICRNQNGFISNFIKVSGVNEENCLENSNNIILNAQFEPSDAIKDLRINEGVRFNSITQLKAHTIASDIVPGIGGALVIPDEIRNAVEELGELRDLATTYFEYFHIHHDGSLISRASLDEIAELNPILKGIRFLELLFEANDAAEFLVNSDIIVGVNSQLAGRTREDPRVSVFNAYHHLNVHQNSLIRNSIIELLALPTSSSKFGPLPPNGNLQDDLNERFVETLEGKSLINFDFPTSDYPDGVNLLSPLQGDTVLVGNYVDINIDLLDTVGLSYIRIRIQDELFYFHQFDSLSLNIKYRLSGKYLENQLLDVLAFYNYGDSTATSSHQVIIHVSTNENLINFSTSSHKAYLRVGEEYIPNFTATYDRFVSTIGHNNPNIQVNIDDNAILSFDSESKAFMGEAVGASLVELNYQGLADTIIFIVSPKNKPFITPVDIDTICSNEELILSTEDIGLSYQWIRNGVPIAGATDNQLVVSTTGIYQTIIENIDGVIDTTHAKLLTVLQAPVLNLETEYSFCEGDSVSLNAGQGDFYLWSNGSSNQDVNISSTGLFSVTVTNNNRCVSIDSTLVTTHETMSPDITFIDNILAASSGISFQWFFNDTLLEVTSQEWNPVLSGNYSVLVEDTNGCFVISNTIYVGVVAVEDIQIEDVPLILFPNPAKNYVDIDLSSVIDKEVSIIVYDQLGKHVYSQMLFKAERIFRIILIDHNFNDGIYFVSVITNKGKQNLKLIID